MVLNIYSFDEEKLILQDITEKTMVSEHTLFEPALNFRSVQEQGLIRNGFTNCLQPFTPCWRFTCPLSLFDIKLKSWTEVFCLVIFSCTIIQEIRRCHCNNTVYNSYLWLLPLNENVIHNCLSNYVITMHWNKCVINTLCHAKDRQIHFLESRIYSQKILNC